MPAERSRRCISQFVNQEVIANQQRILHGSCGNDERLAESCRSKQKEKGRHNPFGDAVAIPLEMIRCSHFQSSLTYPHVLSIHNEYVPKEFMFQ